MKKLKIMDVFDRILNADVVIVDGQPASLKHHANDTEMEEIESGKVGELLVLSYSMYDYVEEAALSSNHVAHVTHDGSGIIINEPNGSPAFSLGFAKLTPINVPVEKPNEDTEEERSEKYRKYTVDASTLAIVTTSLEIIGDGEKSVEALTIEAINEGCASWEYQGTTDDDIPEISSYR